jgi:hypothetical protein
MSRLKTRLRKWTTPIHLLFGIMCCIASIQFFPAGIIILVIFAGAELWNDHCDNTNEGYMDWWESFLTFCITFAIALVLNWLKVINIRWY